MNAPRSVSSSPGQHHDPNRPHGLPLQQSCVQLTPVNVPHSTPRRLSYTDVAHRALGDLIALSRDNEIACQQAYANEVERLRQSCQSSIDNQAREHDEQVAQLIREKTVGIAKLEADHLLNVENLRRNQEIEKEEALMLVRERVWCTEDTLRNLSDELQQVRYENEWIACSFDSKDRECKESTFEVIRMRGQLDDLSRQREAVVQAQAESEKALADCEEMKEAAEEMCSQLQTELTTAREAIVKTEEKLENFQTQFRAQEQYEEESDARLEHLQAENKQLHEQKKHFQDQHRQLQDQHKELQDQNTACGQELHDLTTNNNKIRFERDLLKDKKKQLEGQLQAAERKNKALDAQKSTAEANLTHKDKSIESFQKRVAHLQNQRSTTEQELANKVRRLEEEKTNQGSLLDRCRMELEQEKQKSDRLRREVNLLFSTVDKVTSREAAKVRTLRVIARMHELASARVVGELKECNTRLDENDRLLRDIREMTGQRSLPERMPTEQVGVNRHLSAQLLSPVSDGNLDPGLARVHIKSNAATDIALTVPEQGNEPSASTSSSTVSSSKLTDENPNAVGKNGIPPIEPKLDSRTRNQVLADEESKVKKFPKAHQQRSQAPSMQASLHSGRSRPTHGPAPGCGAQKVLLETPIRDENVDRKDAADPKCVLNAPAPVPSNSPPNHAPTAPMADRKRKLEDADGTKDDDRPIKERKEADCWRPQENRSQYEEAELWRQRRFPQTAKGHTECARR